LAMLLNSFSTVVLHPLQVIPFTVYVVVIFIFIFLFTTRIIFLYRWAFYRAIATIHTAMALQWF
jgi:hypothetical protein